MKHLDYHQRRNNILTYNRKVPLNTIVLPPISPPLPAEQSQLIGRVPVNKSKTGDLMAVTRSNDLTPSNPELLQQHQQQIKGTENARIAQLEQNIRFLQEQHQLMLTGLHNEVENLRNKNRELQFQLIFAKGTLPSSPSSPEDEAKPKVYTSPKQINITPLQIEILEKEMGELKLQLEEVQNRNAYLSAIVDEQQKKLELYENDLEKERERIHEPNPDLLRKLDDAEMIIRRLRRENSDLRRENYQIRENQPISASTSTTSPPTTQQQHKETQRNMRGNGRHRNNYRSGNNWFPPLHSQNYWQGNRNERGGGNNGIIDNTTPLPTLQHNGGGNYQSRRGHSNNNHYHNGDGRKYRGGGGGGSGGQNKSTKPS